MMHIFVAILPAILIGSLFYVLDKNREPIRVVLRAFFFGIFSVPLFYIIYLALPKMTVTSEPTFREVILRAFYTAAFQEELAKYIVFLWAIYRHRHFNEWYDGILYGILVGLGFSFLENIFYFIDATNDLLLLYFGRSVLSMPLHALLGGVMGYFIGKAKFTFYKDKNAMMLFLAFFIPFLLHGLFDFVLMYYAVQLAWLAIPIVVFLWGWILKLKKRTQEQKSLLIG